MNCKQVGVYDPNDDGGGCRLCGSDETPIIASTLTDEQRAALGIVISTPIPVPIIRIPVNESEVPQASPWSPSPFENRINPPDYGSVRYDPFLILIRAADIMLDDDVNYDEDFHWAAQESFDMAPSPPIRPANPGLFDSMDKFECSVENKKLMKHSCSICLEEFLEGEKLVRTKCCDGVTHHNCMKSTLSVTPGCPFCRSTDGIAKSAPN